MTTSLKISAFESALSDYNRQINLSEKNQVSWGFLIHYVAYDRTAIWNEKITEP